MKKTVTALLLSALILLISSPYDAAAASAYVMPETYTDSLFSDVSDDDWFYPYIKTVYNRGLMQGKGGGIFDPGGFLTIGEAVTIASRLRSCYGGNAVAGKQEDYSKIAVRAQFAMLVYNALPGDVFAEINAIPDYAICDVSPESDYADAVYALYRAGIMTGSDRYGTFNPDSYITRAEVCAVLARIVTPELRCYAVLPDSIPAEVIYERSAEAVFMLETFDRYGETIRTGSGFFISAEGLAVTGAHVISGASYVIATLNDGRKYPVLGINAVDAELGLAVFTIERDAEDWKYLTIIDSNQLRTGAPVYVLSSPLALVNSFSAGVVSSESRIVGEQSFIQFSAAISFGSGGGPVFNSLGQVVGVASSSFNAGQRLNLAVPISFLYEMEIGDCLPLTSFLPSQDTGWPEQ